MTMRPSQSTTVRGDIDCRWDSSGATSNYEDTAIAIVENPDGRVSFWRCVYATRFDVFASATHNGRLRDTQPISKLESWVANVASDETRCVCGAWTRGEHCITCRLHAKPNYRCDNPHCRQCC